MDEITKTTEPQEFPVPEAGETMAAPEVVAAPAEPVRLSRKEKKALKKAKKKEKKQQKKTAKKERRKRWKETKKEDRRKLKEHYKDAPWFIRIPRLMIRPLVKITFFATLGITAILLVVGIYYGIRGIRILDALDHMEDEVDKEVIEEMSPYDTEGAERIAAYPSVDPDDTWTICIYMIGADLEDYDENDLSLTTELQISKEKAERKQAYTERYLNRLEKYSLDLNNNGLPLPEFLYYPEKPVAGREYLMNETVVTSYPGCASTDIMEMLSAELSDNITIVIQTGGATRWENTFINPNKTQRFVISKDRYFEEVENLPLQRATDPETLSDFLRFCKKDYSADHTMLVLWDHGSGPFGYGSDSIYGGGAMSINEIRQALGSVYRPNDENPAFDIIGFDACLMSNLEVTHELEGFASFYALSEESEPGDGWNYTPVLEKMSEDPTLSPAAIAQLIADSYTDYYMTINANVGWIRGMDDVTFAVIDAKKAKELYNAYTELTKQQLKDAAKDISVLAEIGRCCEKSPHVSADSYNVFNLVDLGCYADLMVDTYPEEASKIANLLDEAVLYHRQNGSLADTQGMSVYIPGSIDSYYGLHYFLNYEYDICKDDNTRALYFYKMSGCLNDEMMEYVAKLTDAKPTVLDISLFSAFEKKNPVIEEKSFHIPVSEELQKMIQNYTMQLASYDEDTGEVVYYGEDEYLYLDGEGNLCCDFEGEWVYLDGELLAIEITSNTLSSVEYRSHVLYNGSDAYLIFAYNRDTEDFDIKGVRLFPSTDDEINYLVNAKNNMELQLKDSIIPVYPANDWNGMSYDKQGNKITYRSTTKIVMKSLPAGYYLAMADISDQRGDVYNSKVLGYTVSGGKIKKCEIDPDFVATDY